MHHWLHSITYTHANMVSICLNLLPSPTIESSRQFAAPWASRPCIASSHSQWCHSRKWHGSAFMSQVPFIFRKYKGVPKRGQQTSSTCQWNPPTKKQISRKSVKNPQNPFHHFSHKMGCWWILGDQKWVDFWNSTLFTISHGPLAPRKLRHCANLWDLRSLWWRSPLKDTQSCWRGGGWNKDMIKTIPI